MAALRIELDTENYELSPGEAQQLEAVLDPMRAHVENFPTAALYVTLTHHDPRQRDHVNMALVLPGRTLATATTADDWLPAARACVDKLVRRILHHKVELDGYETIAKHEQGTRHELLPDREPDAAALGEAVEASDYIAFRKALFPYEEPLRKRIGRWIARYPEWEAQLGQRWQLADAVEEVFLFAFDQYGHKPDNLRLGQWLESLIDPSLKALMTHTDEELETIHMSQSARDAVEE